MKRIFAPVLITCLAIFLAGCPINQTDNAEVKAFKTLEIMRATIVSAAQTADQLCSQGTLNQTQCDEVSKVYDQSQAAYQLAQTSLETAVKTDGANGSWDKYSTFHNNFLNLYNEFATLAGKLGLLKE